MKYYLCGPMSGYPDSNIPAFREAHKVLTESGFNIILPADLGDEKVWPADAQWIDYLAADIKLVANEVDGIIFLPHWQRSRGATLEAFVALLTRKKHFREYDPQTQVSTVVSEGYVRQRLRVSL